MSIATIKARHQQIKKCQTPRLSYLAFASDADRRMAAGQEQTFCTACERFKWADELCQFANVLPEDEQ